MVPRDTSDLTCEFFRTVARTIILLWLTSHNLTYDHIYEAFACILMVFRSYLRDSVVGIMHTKALFWHTKILNYKFCPGTVQIHISRCSCTEIYFCNVVCVPFALINQGGHAGRRVATHYLWYLLIIQGVPTIRRNCVPKSLKMKGWNVRYSYKWM